MTDFAFLFSRLFGYFSGFFNCPTKKHNVLFLRLLPCFGLLWLWSGWNVAGSPVVLRMHLFLCTGFLPLVIVKAPVGKKKKTMDRKGRGPTALKMMVSIFFLSEQMGEALRWSLMMGATSETQRREDVMFKWANQCFPEMGPSIVWPFTESGP